MSDHERIRVFIVDDHDMVRRGLAAFLLAFPDLELVGEAANGKDALRLCIQVQPDIVLMDLMLPEMDGATATRELRRQYPAIQVIALTSFHQADMVRDVLQAGAIGYLLKNASADELAVAIRAAYAGRPTLAPEATQVLLRAATQPPPPGQDLTPREREVLALMVKGLNNSEIAERLTISHSTVKFHVSSILAKLGATRRVEAVALAVQHHLTN